MMQRCQQCPGTEQLRNFLFEQLREGEEENGDEEEEEPYITFKQWTTVDRSELITKTETVADYIEILIAQLVKSTVHSFIARSQAKALKELKINLQQNEVIVLGDFAENYSFVVQDEIQGMHWNNSQCSLHPIVIYFKNDENELKSHSICFISDDLNHDVDFVHVVVRETVHFVKSFLVDELVHVHYFSDGCAAQYKNCKNFLNLCNHKNDFGVDGTWSFFATSHGKSPCDGIGGTLKRLTARASLQRPTSNQILTAMDFFNFCDQEITAVTSLFISRDEINKSRSLMEERYKMAKTVPGTRSFHHFVPLSASKVATKRLSEDDKYDLEYEFSNTMNVTVTELEVNQYIGCVYDHAVWIGVVVEINIENQDILVKFLHPKLPSQSFHWPAKDDTCWVPNIHLLCKIAAPLTATGRQYNIDPKDRDVILNLWEKF